MKIALFGGSFNPPHLAHVSVVKDLLESKQFDEIWIIPSFKHPFEKNLIPFEDRIEMCHLAFDSLGQQIKVSEIEKEVNSPKGWTIDLIEHLLKKQGEYQFFFVMGSDLLQSTERWKNFDEIKKRISIFPIPRAGYEASKHLNISSSEIREAIAKKQSLKDRVPESVEKYIQKKGLYQ